MTVRDNPRKKQHTGPRVPINFNALAPAYLRIVHMLADGMAHDEDDIIAACAPLVAPNEAARHMTSQRASQGRNAATSRIIHQAQGQRRKIQQKLRSLERNGNLTRTGGKVILNPEALADYQNWAASSQ